MELIQIMRMLVQVLLESNKQMDVSMVKIFPYKWM